MANKHDISDDLVFEIDGHDVTPEKFLNGVKAFFSLVQDFTKNMCPENKRIRWTVQVKAGSNLVSVVPQQGTDPQILTAVLNNFGAIEQFENTGILPEGWGENEIKSLGKIATLSGEGEDDDTTVKLWVNKRPCPVTHKTINYINELNQKEYVDHGSIEGRLQLLSERKGLYANVYDSISDKPIRCSIKAELLEQAQNCFGKRVEIFGHIKYHPDGTPLSIEAEEIIPFPDNADLPSITDVVGILRDYS